MQRIAILSLSAVLTVLFGWLLALGLDDIGDIEGPDWGSLRDELVPAEVLERQEGVRAEVRATNGQIESLREDQALLDESLAHSEATMQQLMDLHRLSLEKGVDPTERQSDALAESQALFLQNQARSQSATERVASLMARKRELAVRADEVDAELRVASRPAEQEFDRRMTRHGLVVASMKLGLLVPLLFLVAFRTHKNRGKRYRPIWIAALVATFFHITVVMHEYFPSEVFNYIAITTGILIILAFLVSVLRRQTVRKPAEVNRKPVADAYSAGRCPHCSFPFQLRTSGTGDAHKAGAPRSGKQPAVADCEPYTCPSCGTGLFRTCGECHSTRHTLLPFCGTCGSEADSASGASSASPAIA